MKKKIAYIITLAAVSVGCFFIGRSTELNTVNTKKIKVENKVIDIENAIELINRFENKEYINIYDINGWECWEENGKVFLEIEDWEISKDAYTLDASYRKIN